MSGDLPTLHAAVQDFIDNFPGLGGDYDENDPLFVAFHERFDRMAAALATPAGYRADWRLATPPPLGRAHLYLRTMEADLAADHDDAGLLDEGLRVAHALDSVPRYTPRIGMAGPPMIFDPDGNWITRREAHAAVAPETTDD